MAMDPSILDAYVDNRPYNTMTGGSVASLRQGTFASWDGLSVDPKTLLSARHETITGRGEPYAASPGMAGFACLKWVLRRKAALCATRSRRPMLRLKYLNGGAAARSVYRATVTRWCRTPRRLSICLLEPRRL